MYDGFYIEIICVYYSFYGQILCVHMIILFIKQWTIGKFKVGVLCPV